LPQGGGSKNFGGSSKGLSASTETGLGFGGTSAGKTGQQESNAVAVEGLIGSQETLAGTGGGKGVGANYLSKAGQQEVVNAKETSAAWQQNLLQGSPVWKISAVKSFQTDGKAYLRNSTPVSMDGQDGSMCSRLVMSLMQASVSNGNNSEALKLEANSLAGNSIMNFNQESCNEENALYNDAIITHSAGSKSKVGGVLAKSQERKKLVMSFSTPVKRSKRREGSVDEDSSIRTQRLKAKKNLDEPGMSDAKSFLSFSNTKIKSNISSLSIDCSNNKNIDVGIDSIKELEYSRLLDRPEVGTTKETIDSTDDEICSDIGSDFGFDHNAIKYLTGDIAENSFGNDGSLIMDFKPIPKTKKQARVDSTE
jgi:hypothetical protein